ARRRTRRSRQLVALLATLLVLAPAAVGYATMRAHDAEAQQRKSDTLQVLLTEAERLRTTNPGLAAQLTLAAYRMEDSEPARDAVLNAFAEPFDSQLVANGTGLLAAAYSPDGSLLAVARVDGIRLSSLAEGHQPRQLTLIRWDKDPQPLTLDIATMAFGPNGRLLAIGSSDGTRLYDLTDPSHPAALATLNATCTGNTSTVRSVAVSPDGRILATARDDGTIGMWDLTYLRGDTPDPCRAAAVTTLHGDPAGFTSVTFSPDGRLLAAGSNDNTTRLWNVTSPRRAQPLATLAGHRHHVQAVAFSPDSRLLATGSGDGTMLLWDVARPRQRPATLDEYIGAVSSVAFSPDGHRLAVASQDGTTGVWDYSNASDPMLLDIVPANTGRVVYSAFSPDGQSLITASDDGTVRRTTLPASAGPSAPIRAITVSSDGHTLATAGDDQAVRLWDLGRGHRLRLVATLPGPASDAGTETSLAFSPTDHILVTM